MILPSAHWALPRRIPYQVNANCKRMGGKAMRKGGKGFKLLMLMWQKLFGAMGHLRHSGVPRIRRSGHKQTKAETCRDMWVKIWTSHVKNCDKSVPTIADGGPNVHPSISTKKFKAMLDPLVQVLSDMHQISKTDLVIIIIIIIQQDQIKISNLRISRQKSKATQDPLA